MDKESVGKGIAKTIKGAVMAVMIAIIGILILAGSVKLLNLSQAGIKTVNQFIKTLAIFLGCIFSVKQNAGLLKGIFVGVIFALIIHLIFGLMGSFFNSGSFFIDLLFCAIIGAISGIISVNIKRKSDI